MAKEVYWDNAVAKPAPAMPISSTKMNRGSRAMFRIPPVVRPIMARVAIPSYRRMLLSTQLAVMAGAANRIQRP